MVTFRNNSNNSRRNNFRRNDRNFKSNGERQKFSSNFANNDNFKRKAPGRNNHNAPKLIEKYNDLAREALSNGDKILSENYLQHADHFTRILNEKESYKKDKLSDNRPDNNSIKSVEIEENVEHFSQKDLVKASNKNDELDTSNDETKTNKSAKPLLEFS